MSGARRALASFSGSIFFALAKSNPLSRTSAIERSIGTNVSIAIECIEIFIFSLVEFRVALILDLNVLRVMVCAINFDESTLELTAAHRGGLRAADRSSMIPHSTRAERW